MTTPPEERRIAYLRPAMANDPRRNLRTALALISVALVFFAGVIVNRWLFGH